MLRIIVVILAIVIILLLMRLSAKVSFIDGKFSYDAKFWLLLLLNSDGGGIVKKLLKKRESREDTSEDYDYDLSDDLEDLENSENFEIYDDNSPDDGEISEDMSPETESHEEEDTDTTRETADKKERKEKKEKRRAKKREKSPDKDSPEKEPEKEKREGQSLAEKIEFVLDVWRCADRPLIGLMKGFVFSDFFIDFIVADEDAYKCAISYGAVSGAVYNLLAFIGTAFTIKFKTVDINAGFGLEECRWDISFRLKFRLGTLVTTAVWFVFVYLFRVLIPQKIHKNQ